MPYKHLDKKTIPILEKNIQVKIKWVRKDHFVYHPKAIACLNKFNWIYEQTFFYDDMEDLTHDMESISLIGNTGLGKSSIINELRRTHSRQHNPTFEKYPVAYCLLKDSITGLKGLYTSLLSAYAHPYAKADALKMSKVTIGELEDVFIHTLKETGTKLFIIDEFQHTKGRNQRAILNMLKRTMLASQVPFIPVGMPETKLILDMDMQLSNRCPVRPYSHLRFLKFKNDEYRSFLSGYEKFQPFPEPSDLSSKDFANMIFDKVQLPKPHLGESNRRNIAILIKTASVIALRNKHNRIEEEDLKNAQL